MSPYPFETHANGSLAPDDQHLLARQAESGPLVSMDVYSRCIVLHIYEALITVIPINSGYTVSRFKGDRPPTSALREPFHARTEYTTILALEFLKSDVESPPQLTLLAQNTFGEQSVNSCVVDIATKALRKPGNVWLPKKALVDGGSAILVAVPPRISSTAASTVSTTQRKLGPGGVLVVGQEQISYLSSTATKDLPCRQTLFLSVDALPADAESGLPRYLLADDCGNWHMISFVTDNTRVTALQRIVLGTTSSLANSLVYLEQGLVFCGSAWGDSQILQIHKEPVPNENDDAGDELSIGQEMSYLSIFEEFTQLGPIVDMDRVGKVSAGSAPQIVTASGTSASGSLRLIRNGVGWNEYAAVPMQGLSNMWSIKSLPSDTDDSFLVQSFVGETRVLAVVQAGMEEEEDGTQGEGSLEEVTWSGLDSCSSSLYVGGLGSVLLQVTDTSIRIFSQQQELMTWNAASEISVAAANDAGQVVVAYPGGEIIYLQASYHNSEASIEIVGKKQLNSDVSCLDLNPFIPSDGMEVEPPLKSGFLAVGLWDEACSVRLFTLESVFDEATSVSLAFGSGMPGAKTNDQRTTNSSAISRSLALVSLDHSSMSPGESKQYVHMLFVGLGDGTVVSFVIEDDKGTTVLTSRKEVCLGTQRVDLIKLQTACGGSCVLATGDRPTVIYLAGAGSLRTRAKLNPKLCYANVNLSTSETPDGGISLPQRALVCVATSFRNRSLFEATNVDDQRYSLCIADDSCLRLGVIDDIQKLHVTTCRLGMAPRRVVHIAPMHCFVVGCLAGNVKHFGLETEEEESNMGNCVRVIDDSSFEDLQRIDMEPFEIILSIAQVELAIVGETQQRPFLVVGSAYALPQEDEPTRGRILLYSFPTDMVEGGDRVLEFVSEYPTTGGVYSITQFFQGMFMCTINSKAKVCQLTKHGSSLDVEPVGRGHHGHILSLCIKCRATTESPRNTTDADMALESNSQDPNKKQKIDNNNAEEKIAIVGDLMRSISLVQFYPEHNSLEEIARDFNMNWITSIEMLTDSVYLGAENWNNLFCLRRNTTAASEEERCRLDTIGECHLGEIVNTFMPGSLVMPVASPEGRQICDVGRSQTQERGQSNVRLKVTTGSQTLFGTVDGSLGVVIGMDANTAIFFACLQRCMTKTIRPVGELNHAQFRASHSERRMHPCYGFVDGDLVESFLDLDVAIMEKTVQEMNNDGSWRAENVEANEATANRQELALATVIALVEEMTMLH